MEVVTGTASVGDVTEFVEALAAVGDDHDCVVQAVDAELVTGRDHLATALRYAARAHRRDDAVARDPAVEVLLYAAGRRQIDRAFAMGVDEGENAVAVVVASDFPTAPLDDDDVERAAATDVTALLDDAHVLEADDALTATEPGRVHEFFDIGAAEREATDADLAALVRERVVLLAIDH